MTEIGFNTASIGVMVAIMSSVMLVVETPSGILADRWSRKGVMLLGCASLLVAAVVGGFSYNEPVFILSTVFWGVYAALYSGTYDSVIYDTTLEEEGNPERYEYFLGRLRAVEGIGFVIGALLGGAMANLLSMRDTFYLSLPLIAVGGFYLLQFHEPKLHKAEIAEPVFRHIRQTFAAVLRKRILLPIVIATVGFAVVMDTLFELSQLWYIELSTPVVLYGIFSAILFSTWSLGGILAGKLKNIRSRAFVPVVALLALCMLVYIRNYWIILLAQFLLGACLVALSVILSRKLHDELPSKTRAGSASVMSTVGRFILIPGSLLFTFVANQQNVFTASYMLLFIGVVATMAYVLILKRDGSVVRLKAK